MPMPSQFPPRALRKLAASPSSSSSSFSYSYLATGRILASVARYAAAVAIAAAGLALAMAVAATSTRDFTVKDASGNGADGRRQREEGSPHRQCRLTVRRAENSVAS
ncbi:hypothetical protein ACP4OV_020745 [Aristida adscensionis]